MYYQLQDRKTFEKQLDEYLSSNPTHLVYERNKIDSFSSDNLSDLYKLLLSLKGHKLDKELFLKLSTIMHGFSMNPEYILSAKHNVSQEYLISEKDVNNLAKAIKDKFSVYVNSPEKLVEDQIDENEFGKLAVIINKNFPSFFPSLVKDPKENIAVEQEYVLNALQDTLDHWNRHNIKSDSEKNIQGAKEKNRDILGGIYIVAKQLYPELNIYIPARIKSTYSAINNINKELFNSLNSLIPSDPSKGLSEDDIKKQFSLKKANTDFTGFTIVLSNTDDTLHFDTTNPENAELMKLRKNRTKNINFYHYLENFLNECDTNSKSLSNVQLLQIKIDLLKILRSLTYEECIKEYKGRSFTEFLDEAIIEYKNIPKDYETFYEQDVYEEKIAEIYTLLDELKSRVHDKYQAKILEMSLPDILNNNFITQVLGVKSEFVKNVKKENGFCADYYELSTPDNRKIELQAITRYRFKESKSGQSNHNTLPNKEIDIYPFFEKTSENISQDAFEKYLQLLNDTSVTEKNILYSKSSDNLSSFEKRKKNKLQNAEKSIKLKNTMDVDGTTIDMDSYLPGFASYVSPELMSVSSHHTRFNNSIASYDEKSEISAFKEVLLKNDQISCLAQILIDKLELLLPNVKSEISMNGIIRRTNELRPIHTPGHDREIDSTMCQGRFTISKEKIIEAYKEKQKALLASNPKSTDDKDNKHDDEIEI